MKYFCFFLALTVTISMSAANQVVTNNNDSGAGSLRQAIVDAGDGDEITFNLTSGNETITILSQLAISESLTFDGSNTAGSGVDVTVKVTTPGTSGYRVFRIEASGKTISIKNMTIKGGNLSSNPGGAVYIVSNSTVNFDFVNISDSKAGYGGGIYITGSTCSITNSTVTGNVASERGGGINVTGSSTITNLTNTTISNNSCPGFGGGGIYVKTGTISNLANSTITNNSSGTFGGGIFIFQEGGASTIDLSNSTVYNNTASSNGDDIYMSGGTLTAANNIVDNFYSSYGSLTDNGYNVVVYCNIAANATGGFGNSTSILYNTKYNTSGTSYTSWSQGGTVLSNQNLNLSSTLANNGGPTQTLALLTGSFAEASGSTGIPPTSNWNNSPLIDGLYTDQRGVERTAGQNTSIGAYSENYSSSQATNVSFSNTSNSGTTVSWTRGLGDYCAVFMVAASSGTASPVDNTTYSANTAFGTGTQIGSTGWYCIYNGTGTSVSVTGLSANTNYQVHVCEYDGTGGSETYNTDSGNDNPGNLYTVYGGGIGSSGDPYQISTKGDLIYLSNTTDDWDKYFIQTVDIAFNSDETQEDWDGDGSADGAGTSGFSPIGNSTTKFTGEYNGGGYNIDNLYISNNASDVGLFGYQENSSIESLAITNATIISSGGNTGVLVGRSASSTITNCYTTGSVGNSGVYKGGLGGLINSSDIAQCFSSCSVTADTRSGGFIGKMDAGSSITNCYSTGAVSVGDYGGGFLGISYSSSSTNCFSVGSLSGSGINRGGFAGYDDVSATYPNSFWDTQTSGFPSSTGGTGKTTAELKDYDTFTDETTVGLTTAWDFVGNPNDDTGNNNYWDMDQDETVNGGYPILSIQNESDVVLANNQWTGNTSTDWQTAANWDENIVPSENYDVTIPTGLTNYPELASSGTCNKLTVSNAASLTINSDGSLITNGTISNNGTITMERTLTGSAQAWHTISGPAAVDISDNGWDPGNDDDFYAWDEADPGTWVNYKVSSGDLNFPGVNGGDNFIAGKGYLVAYNSTNPNKTITGTPNTGDVSFTLKNSGATKNWTFNSGWNLLGNPYPSSIDWNLADRSQFQDNFAYIYDPNKPGGEGYITIDGGSSNAYITPHQAFFTQATTGANNQNFVFSNSIRAHGGSFYKNENNATTLTLRLASETFYDETKIMEHENSLAVRDRRDALKLYSFDPQIPQLYTFSEEGVELSVNSLPTINEKTEILLGLILPESGQYQLSCQQIIENMSLEGVWLHDMVLGSLHNLTDTPYPFSSNETELHSRFKLLFSNKDVNTEDDNSLSTWVFGNELYFYNMEETIQFGIYDLTGRRIHSGTISGSGENSLSIQHATGVYLIHLSNSITSRTIKAVIKH